MKISAEQRFWSKVDKSGGADGCWPWTRGKSKRGYGYFYANGRYTYGHIFSFELANGYSVPEVRHSCDNPPCCNPKHLLGGTHRDNIRDTNERGHQPKGETHGHVKLTEAQVLEAKRRYIPFDRMDGASAIAREFGVSQTAVSYAISGRQWKYLGNEK